MNIMQIFKCDINIQYFRALHGLSPAIFLIILILIPFSVAQGQMNTINGQEVESYSVEWIGEFPSKDSKQSSAFKEKMAGIILGKKKVEISKPFSIFGSNPNNFWILDQGIGMIIRNSGGTSEIPLALRKENNIFPSLAGICAFTDENLLFTDSRLNQIFILSTDGKTLRKLYDSIKLDQPTGIAWSEISKEIWVVETHAHQIAVLNQKGEVIRKIGNRGNGPGEFNYPTFIWIDSSGNVYIVDSMNFRVQIFNKNGEYISSFGEIGDASGYFARPKGVATDSHGHIYVADALYHVVQIYDIEGNFLHYFGSQGHGKEEFWMPGGIFIDENDYIYVADTYNSRIQIFKLVNKQ
jgi:sugar lactone lactonase YvrE